MGSIYRLKQLDLALPAGSHILPQGEAAGLHEAAGILETAEAEASRIRGEAKAVYEAERARGYAEGIGKAELDTAARLIAETELLGRRLSDVESKLAELVIGCVRRIMEGFSDDEKARSFVRSALKRMRQESRVELRVPPAKVKEARASAANLVDEFPEIDLIDVVEDNSLEPRKLILESPLGRIAIDLDGGLEHLRHLLHAPSPITEGEKHD